MSKKEAKQEKGQARIQQLTEQFPEMPREALVAADYGREGMRHTPVLDQIGRWAWPDAHDHYEYDYEAHKEGDLVDGVSRTPKKITIGNVKNLQVMFDSHSPYEVKYEGGGRYWLYRDDEPIEQVYFLACPQWFWKKTSSGRPMNLMVNSAFEGAFGMYVTDYCEYFKYGDQCRFCNLNTTGDEFAKLRGGRVPVKRQQDVYETFVAMAQEGLNSISLLGGSFLNRSKEADLYIRNIKTLKRAMRDSGCQVKRLGLVCQAMDEADQLRLKEAGATDMCANLEVWDPKLFEVICPGKSKNVGRERWIDLLFKGVETFGWGKAFTNFVVGTEMAPPFGDKTEEQEEESVMDGMQYMASHGVSLVLTICRANPGSHLERAGRPRVEHYLTLQRERGKLQTEYNLRNLAER